uniref:Ribosomal protein S13 n=1 Tax=Sciadococcus taiwanensis TaxID=3028030 RepID=A0A9Y1I2A7_9RHOD|nr:ribosomal protein S13 [Sciadococcus taiwanensis]
MVRIAGIDLPRTKRVERGLTYIFGIGLTSAQKILEHLKINPDLHIKELEEEQIIKLREYIENEYQIEGDLRRFETLSVKRLIDINCYRGRRHRLSLPVHGQRTKTNARTRRGSKKTVAGKKKAK